MCTKKVEETLKKHLKIVYHPLIDTFSLIRESSFPCHSLRNRILHFVNFPDNWRVHIIAFTNQDFKNQFRTKFSVSTILLEHLVFSLELEL